MAQVPAPAPHVNAAPAIVRTACPGGAGHDVCGFVRVPLDRKLPDGRTIRIYFERRAPPGPAGPPVARVLWMEAGRVFRTPPARRAGPQLWSPLPARRDLLLVDL